MHLLLTKSSETQSTSTRGIHTHNHICVFLISTCLRYGRWEEILGQSPPPRDARGVTTYGGPQFASVVFHAGRVLALAAKAQLASQQLLEVEDMTAFDLARKSL